MNKIIKKAGLLVAGLAIAGGIWTVAANINNLNAIEVSATPGESPMTSTFNSKSWGVSSGDAWTSTTAGDQMDGSRGVQILKGNTGVAVSSEIYTNISKITVTAGTASKATATVSVKVGSGTAKTWSLAKGTANTAHDFTFSPTESGKVTLSVAASGASAYCASVTITYAPVVGPQVNSVTLNKTTVKMDRNASTTADITVDADDGASYSLTAVSSDETVATASILGTTLTVNSQNKYGSADITVSAGGQSVVLKVKVLDPNQLKFLQPVSSLGEISNGDTLVLGGHYGDVLYAMTPSVVDASGKGNYKCVAVESDNTWAWKDTFGDDTVYTARIDLNDYGITVGKDSTNLSFLLPDDTYLAYDSGTNLTTSESAVNWAVANGSVGTFRITESGGRALALSASAGTFGAYATQNLKSGSAYADIEIYKVVDLTGITKLSITCDGAGNNSANWPALKSTFEGISKAEWKAYYKHASYSSVDDAIVAAENTDSDIAQFVAKYDYIVHKYNKTGDDDFIQRSGTAFDLYKAGQIVQDFTIVHHDSLIAPIVITISATALVGGSLFAFARRRKED